MALRREGLRVELEGEIDGSGVTRSAGGPVLRSLSTTCPSAARVRRSAESGGLEHVVQQMLEPAAVALVEARGGLHPWSWRETDDKVFLQ